MAAGWEPFTIEGIEDTVSAEPTTAKRLHETDARVADARVPGTEGRDGPLWYWVARYAPANRPTQRALYRACRSALHHLHGELESPEAARLTPRIVERTIDRYLAHLLGVAEPPGRVARGRLKVHAMTSRSAPVGRPANANPAPTRAPAPAPLLPPEAPLDMPEQDLS